MMIELFCQREINLRTRTRLASIYFRQCCANMNTVNASQEKRRSVIDEKGIAQVSRRTYSVSKLSRSTAYISERIRLGDRLIQVRHIEQSVQELRSDFTAKELRAFADEFSGYFGWFHIALEDYYEVTEDGSYYRELTEVFRAHLRFVRRFAERAERPWSRWTIRLVE